MKKIMLMIASIFMVSSVAFASPTQQMDFASMNKADSQFLFNGKANVITLNNVEMVKTEGEWGWIRSVYRGSRYVYRNTRFDGYNGSRMFQLRWKSRPVFRVDYKANPSPSRLHLHFGNMRSHRPWYAPWRRY